MLYVIFFFIGALGGAGAMAYIAGCKLAEIKARQQGIEDNARSFENAEEYSEAGRYYKDGQCTFKCPKNFYSCCSLCPIGNTCLVSCGYACKEE